MKKLLYILLLVIVCGSCQNEVEHPQLESPVLDLGISRAGVSSGQSIDDDLAIKILDANGDVYIQYSAGRVPKKIVLSPGTFTAVVYTENQTTWMHENNGLGAPCYYGTAQLEMGFDQVVYLNMQVPMTNYAVTLTLPELFEKLFYTHSLSLISGSRSVNIQNGQKAYFSAENGSFTYKLSATNTDNKTSHTSAITYKNVESGKLYNLNYYYGTDANSGGLDIEITDDMETEDTDVPLL